MAPTRSSAQALLLAGRVRLGSGDGARTDRKAGDMVHRDAILELVERPPFVSRGGEKLAAALRSLEVDPGGRICLDVGASTGGFTDCLLKGGARRVYALDVGRGQISEVLRSDPRVICLERTHASRLDPTHPDAVHLPEMVSLAVVDVSFISLTRVLAAVSCAVVAGGEMVALVKPQFEAGPKEAPKGVVRDPAVRRAAVERVMDHASSLGLLVQGEVESVLAGPSGNREIFVHLRVRA